MIRGFIQFLFIALLPLLAIGQPDFTNIRICHNENGTLKNVRTEEYNILMDESKLSSFNTLDNAVQYDAVNRRLTVETNVSTNSKLLTIQLTKTELLIQSTDSSIALTSKKSSLSDSTATFRFGGILVPVEFKYGLLNRIFLNMGNKLVTINIYGWEGHYFWGIVIESPHEKRSLNYTETLKDAPSIVLQDEIKKNGIFLYPSRKKFNEIKALYMLENTWRGAGAGYSLKYNKQGKLKNNETKLNLTCE